MIKRHHARIRELLTKHEDGLTLSTMSMLLGTGTEALRGSILSMPDVYRDRWEPVGRNTYAAVYCKVPVPEDCPHPKDCV